MGPQEIVAWLESTSVEAAVRNAISVGEDSDTIACISVGIAEVEFRMNINLQGDVLSYIYDYLLGVVA